MRFIPDSCQSAAVLGIGVCKAMRTTSPAALSGPACRYPVKACAVRGGAQS